MNTLSILMSAFVLSLVGLGFFIWSQRSRLLSRSADGSEVIFARGEIGHPETLMPDRALDTGASAVDSQELLDRAAADASTAPVVFFFYCCAFVWLLVASAAGLTASIKLHAPDWLVSEAWLSFGRIRTVHLNAVAYGWAPMAGLGTALFIIPRLLKTELVGGRYAVLGGALWNAALVAGLGSLAYGVSDGMEWLEIPWQIDILFVAGGALVGLPLILTLLRRKVAHLYVSVWYMGCALFWFPVLFFVANFPGLHRGVEAATMN